MNIVVLTADEPLYLPGVIHRFLERMGAPARGVFVVPSRFGRSSTWRMMRKYQAAFGWMNAWRLGRRVVWAKVCDRLGVGRGRGRFYSVRAAASAHGVGCEAIEDVNDPAFLERLRGMGVDVVVSISCPQIFRRELIELPKLGCINLHGAPLPRYRGLFPSFWMMANGEKRAAVCVLYIDEGIDTGEVIERAEFDIGEGESLHEFIVRSKRIGCDALIEALGKMETGTASRERRDGEAGSYFGFPTREAYREFRRRGRRLW